MKKSKIPTLLGILILVIGIAAGVMLIRSRLFFRLGATGEFAPKDVRISNITDTSLTISWVTDRETSGFVRWGENQNSLSRTELDELATQSHTHTLTLRGLSPQTTYFFKINSGGEDFDNNGVPWQITTGSALATPNKTVLISGIILTATGEPAKNALVYLTIGGSSLLSTITSATGNWVAPISSARTADLQDYIQIDEKNSLIEISVNAGLGNVASAQIYPQSAKPAPSIILGQVHDFKNLPPAGKGQIPSASIGLPEEKTPSSGFKVEEKTATPSAKNVTLESIKEGEVITTTDPEFFGKGPSGVTITITVESEPVSETLKIPSSGQWKWSPPSNLAEGTHTITISWRDASGILRTLRRTFIVQASEGPSFEATPSASPTSTPRPSPSPSPSPTVSPIPTITPRISPIPSTSSGVYDSGNLTPTVLFSILGVGIILVSLLIWRKTEI